MKEFIKKNLIWIIIIGVITIGLGISTIVLGVKYNDLKGEEKETKTNEDSNTNTIEHNYDFYITLGTMPTLYATLNAYQNQNPNTYMRFYREIQ